MTRHQYNIIREQIRIKRCKPYPLSYSVRQTKIKCYLDAQFISISDDVGKFKFYSLFDHIIRCILKVFFFYYLLHL